MLATVLVLASVSLQDEAPEKLFRRMEEKIAGARTLQSAFKASFGGEARGELAGGFLLQGQSGRMTLEGTAQGKPVKILRVSDGKRTKVVSQDNAIRVEEETPPRFGEDTRTVVSRLGFCTMFFSFMRTPDSSKEGKPLAQTLVTRDFSKGAREKVGERDAQAVSYTLVETERNEVGVTVSVWVDLETALPLKRVVTFRREGKEVTITETSSDFRLDAEIEPSKFELPK